MQINKYDVQTGSDENGNPTYQDEWSVGASADPHALASVTFALPTVYQTSTTQQPGTSGVLSAGGSISLTAGSLSNQGGQIAAQGNVSLNIQSLNNGAVAPTQIDQVTDYVNQSQYSAFLSQIKALGTIGISGSGDPTGTYGCDTQDDCNLTSPLAPTTIQINTGSAAPTSSGTLSSSTPTGMIAAGNDINIASGGNLTNSGLIYAGNNVDVQAGSLTNQGGNQQNYSSQVGCASGVPNSACNNGGSPRGNNPNTTTFSYSQSDATIYAGNDLVIAAGQINNTYGNLLAGHNIVIGGVGTTASSTTPAQSLNNTSGNIVAGNNITLDVSGAITNNLPPPVPVHQNYGSQQQYSGCMTAGGYKESYCEAYVDQQSGSSSVISAGNNLQINAGSLTNIGSLISAGTSATIAVSGPVVNEAQTLNAYWHSEWVQETDAFSADKRHNVWACGSVAECTELYGSVYTSVGGTIDPPTPVGNVAATIEAPNLSITSGGVIQNVGNVIGTSVALTGQKLINGITTANTYTPSTNSPSQVISLSPLTMPGLDLSTPRSIGTGSLPTPVAGQASYVDGTLSGAQASLLGPQQLLSALPANLQPSSTLFYYNPQEEDLLLQQAALQQTGQASFITGLSYNSTTGASITDQEKQDLYGNALNYAEQNNLQLGTALTQTQINALTEPMLWYVEQTVPDPTCTATGTATCPTITALMPQVYLPQNTSALSAGGNIQASNSLTLNFGNAANGGSVTNTGSITSGGTLTVNTGTLTNEANQVNVGSIWNSVKGGYTNTTGTEVQPGGFMSAANMDLNVQTLNQIGGALQELNSDGTVNQAGTQQMLAALQQQLGGNFTQSTVSNDLQTSFTKEGGFGIVGEIGEMVAAIALSYFMGPLAAAMLSAALDDVINTGSINPMDVLKAGLTSELTAGLDSGLGLNDISLTDVGNDIANGTASVGALTQGAEQIVGQSLVSAAVNTAVYGGSFGQAMVTGVVSDLATVGASAIGEASLDSGSVLASGTPGYWLAHAALGCAASAAEGTGCASGAIGGGLGAFVNPIIDGDGNIPAPVLTAITTAVGGTVAGVLGYSVQGAGAAAENETENNWLKHGSQSPMYLSEQQQLDNAVASCNGGNGDSDACQLKTSLEAVSQARDATLQGACASGPSDACTDQIDQATEAGNNVVSTATNNGYVTFANSPGTPTIVALPDSYQSLFYSSLDGQAATSTSQALSMAPIDAPVSLGGLFSKILGFFGHSESVGVLGTAVGESASVGSAGSTEVISSAVDGSNVSVNSVVLPDTAATGTSAAAPLSNGDAAVGDGLANSATSTTSQVPGVTASGGPQGGGAAATTGADSTVGSTASSTNYGFEVPGSSATDTGSLRVTNGVSLNPALPDPLAGLDYQPTVLNSLNPNIAYSQVNGYIAELNLANEVAGLPGQTVVSYGDAVGTHGADVVSVDANGNVTLWDSKYRSGTQSIQSSPTFTLGSAPLNNAIQQAQSAIETSALSQTVKDQAIENLNSGNFTTNTVGSGNAKNSVQVRFCGSNPC